MQNHKERAMKVIHDNKAQADNEIEMLRIMNSISSDFIVKMDSYFPLEIENTQCVCIVFEKLHTNLFQAL